jgi:hypothetical protein
VTAGKVSPLLAALSDRLGARVGPEGLLFSSRPRGDLMVLLASPNRYGKAPFAFTFRAFDGWETPPDAAADERLREVFKALCGRPMEPADCPVDAVSLELRGTCNLWWSSDEAVVGGLVALSEELARHASEHARPSRPMCWGCREVEVSEPEVLDGRVARLCPACLASLPGEMGEGGLVPPTRPARRSNPALLLAFAAIAALGVGLVVQYGADLEHPLLRKLSKLFILSLLGLPALYRWLGAPVAESDESTVPIPATFGAWLQAIGLAAPRRLGPIFELSPGGGAGGLKVGPGLLHAASEEEAAVLFSMALRPAPALLQAADCVAVLLTGGPLLSAARTRSSAAAAARRFGAIRAWRAVLRIRALSIRWNADLDATFVEAAQSGPTCPPDFFERVWTRVRKSSAETWQAALDEAAALPEVEALRARVGEDPVSLPGLDRQGNPPPAADDLREALERVLLARLEARIRGWRRESSRTRGYARL